MSKIKWLPEAVADIQRLHKFLYDKNQKAAARAMSVIRDAAEILRSAPYAGRAMPDDSQRREWVAPFGSGDYVMRYRLEDDETVVIIRVWHSREDRKY